MRSRHENALPLILVHGWPGSISEFQKAIGPLTDPEKFGGRAEDAFHVVIPSLPGFGFSSQPKDPGWNADRLAEVMAKLMARFGYVRYGAQGGDWGAGIVNWLAEHDGAHCIGSRDNFPRGNKPADRSSGGATPPEIEKSDARDHELADQKATSTCTRPARRPWATV